MAKITHVWLGATFGLLIVAQSSGTWAQSGGDPQKAVDAAYAKFKDLKEGKNSD